MRRVLLLPPLLLLLGPVPGGCSTPCPPGSGGTQPCGLTGSLCQPCARTQAVEPVTGDPSPTTPKFLPPEATGQDIIPVYCSLLAAVVVGLLAYVAFKCWHTCRQKQQLAKARAGDLGSSPDGEKLQSDSGVFLDTHSLQEPHQPGKAPRPEGTPLCSVAPQRQEELPSAWAGRDGAATDSLCRALAAIGHHGDAATSV
ncbi:death domain-containing membrane protein NRADD-like [Colius striatus]|uniref:death domain-containing membrane protein NRADD-like n=1 Tax=Colius striatus TaxID=57412 RepID=UPI002B1DE305|nr:death domain-containing membrane protein NRADD-like [Colius striatus]